MAATFKIERLKDFTVMTNHHLKNTHLSLKAKGLQSLLLSLPEDWDYSINGLVTRCKDGRDGVMTALKELEEHGYLTRTRVRNAKGQLTDTEYVIYQIPQVKNPNTENPTQENPTQEKPMQEKPTQDFPIQSNIHKSNTHIMEYTSINQSNQYRNENIGVENHVENYSDLEVNDIIEYIKSNINYNDLCKQYNKFMIDNVVDVMTEVFCAKDSLYINRQKMSCRAVQRMYEKIDYDCVVYVIDCIADTSKKHKIKNMKSYLMTALYNAPMTIDAYYAAQFNSDFESDDSG